MKKILTLVSIFLLAGIFSPAWSQGILKRLKDKASNAVEKAAGDAVEKKVNETLGVENTSNNSGNTNSGNQVSIGGKNNPVNKTGAGLVTTPPDVKANLQSSATAYKANNFSASRSALQQAMLGVEMEIGKKVLLSLPESVAGAKAQKEEDKVTSTGWGWVGLTIYREYLEGEQQLRTTIANNAAWMGAINLFFTSAVYAQQTNGEQKWKQVQVKGHKGIIEYDESSGYKLSVPLGQSSLIIWEGVNFADEQAMIKAAESFDIDGIRKTFGEK
jgi:hypothetical protein